MSIKKLRKQYDESQAAFSRRIGVTPDALQFWEQGRGVPSAPVELLLDRLKEDADSDEIRPHPDAPHTNGHSRLADGNGRHSHFEDQNGTSSSGA